MPATGDRSNTMETVQAVGSGHAANQARHLKPHHIPKWIVTHPVDQPSPQGISHNVTSRSHQCFFASNSTVMKTWHPEPPTGRTNLASHTATCRLQTIDQARQVIRLTKLDQPVRMIRHQHPCQHAAIPQQKAIIETARRSTCHRKLAKHRATITGYAGKQISHARAGYTAFAQGPITG